MVGEQLTPIEAVSIVAGHLTQVLIIVENQAMVDIKNAMLWGRVKQAVEAMVPLVERLRKYTEVQQ